MDYYLNTSTAKIKVKNNSAFSINVRISYILNGKTEVIKSNSISFLKSYTVNIPLKANSLQLSVYKNKNVLFYYAKIREVANKCYSVSGTFSKTICKEVRC